MTQGHRDSRTDWEKYAYLVVHVNKYTKKTKRDSGAVEKVFPVARF